VINTLFLAYVLFVEWECIFNALCLSETLQLIIFHKKYIYPNTKFYSMINDRTR